MRALLLLDVKDADMYLMTICILLLIFCFKLVHAFSRPPPVHRKLLPRRPALQILFKPDDISTALRNERSTHSKQYDAHDDHLSNQFPENDIDDDVSSIFDEFMSRSGSTTKTYHSNTTSGKTNNSQNKRKSTPIVDLPDSFAPLLSSSQMEILTDNLTSDLLHAAHVEGSIRLQKGRHEIPLDIDSSRPQLILEVPNMSGCKVTAVASIGSDGVSNRDDLDVSKPTAERSKPLVKHAGLLLDPPLPLVNVAPTLIHFPTLFEDNVVKYTLRRLQIVRYALDFVTSMSAFIEKVLWIVETKCQIHLGKISLTPLYKGEQEGSDDEEIEPQWRLNLAFSGHVLFFGWIPIPFVNITLPTWIIPQPHALLENLLTTQPLASAKLRRERIAEERIALAMIDVIDSWNFTLEAVATPPALSVDLSLSGGISVAVETMHGTDVSGGRPRGGVEATGNAFTDSNSVGTMSTCTMYTDTQQKRFHRRRFQRAGLSQNSSKNKIFDANDLVPWKFDLAASGTIERDKISVSLRKCIASHDPSTMDDDGSTGKSKISLFGHFIACKPDPILLEKTYKLHRRSSSTISLNDINNLQSHDKSIASILLFTEKKHNGIPTTSHRRHNVLQYDYDLNIGEDTTLDAVSLSIGASHPMLKGGTIITAILENIYAHGTLAARDNSLVDMSELSRKRNILRHLPAVGLSAGIQNFFIPEESFSFSDDGQTKCLPELNGGQLMIRIIGGFPDEEESGNGTAKTTSLTSSLRSRRSRENLSNIPTSLQVSQGIKVIMDFGIPSIVLNNESNVSEVSFTPPPKLFNFKMNFIILTLL